MTGPTWWVELSGAWRRSLERRGRARNTVRTYTWVLGHFGAFLEAEAVQEAADLVPPLLHRWQDSLAGYEPHSRSVAASCLRGILRWAAREQLGVQPGLWEHVDPVEVPEDLPRALEPAALRAILEHYAAPRRDLAYMRDRALFLVLLTTGCRISEALQVDVQQLQGRIVVRQKGGRQHLIVMSARAREWVSQYLRVRGRDDERALWIRPGPRGRHRLRREEANATWRQLAERLRIPAFSAHALRHTGATELLEHGATEVDVAQHLGHRGLGTVHRYAKLRAERRQELVDRLDDLVPPAPQHGGGPAAADRRARRRRSVRILRRDGPAA